MPNKRVVPPTDARRILKPESGSTREDKSERAAVESLPHLVTRLTALWGYVECQPYLRRLIVAGMDAADPRLAAVSAVHHGCRAVT